MVNRSVVLLAILAVGCSRPTPPSSANASGTPPPAPIEAMIAQFEPKFGDEYWKFTPGRVASPAHPEFVLSYPAPRPTTSEWSQLAARVDGEYGADLSANEQRLTTAREAAAAHPDDRQAVFTWATGLYAQRRAYARVGSDYLEGVPGRAELGAARWALAATDPKNDFAFTRLRFILESVFGDDASLPLGRALNQSAPDDLELARALAFHLGHSRRQADLDEALRRSQELLRRDPSRLSFIRLPALIYQNRYANLGRRASDRRGEIEWLRRYIAAAPANSDTVANARRRLSEIGG